MEPLFEFDLALSRAGSGTLVQDLHLQLKAAILDGRLHPGQRMPSTRALAQAFSISRNTALAGYDLLLAEGYLTARPGSGNFVSETIAARPRSAPPRVSGDRGDPRLNAFSRHLRAPAAEPPGPPLVCDFQLGVPDKASVHFEHWRRLSARALRRLPRRAVGYGPAEGQPALREAIAGYASFARAVSCRAEDVVVTAGAQQAFDLLARVLVTPGRTTVAVEDPGYPPMRAAFAAAGARVVPVRVDADGIVVDAIPPEARVICVTPSHQFPTGCVLAAERRSELLRFARERHAVIIEDDYDGEFRYGGRPLDALQTLDRSGCVFFVGTFSKNLFPALRLGYVVAPPWALLALVTAKQRADWHCNLLAQDTLAAFIGEGHLARHVRHMRQRYAARRALLLRLLAAHFATSLEPVPGIAGLHLCAMAHEDFDVDRFAQRAREAGVGLSLVGRYANAKPAPRGLVFGYGATDEAMIQAGFDRLQRLLPPRQKPRSTKRATL